MLNNAERGDLRLVSDFNVNFALAASYDELV